LLLPALIEGIKCSNVSGCWLIGTTIDVFRGKAAVREQEDEKYPTQLSKTIKVSTGFLSLYWLSLCHVIKITVIYL